MKKDAILRTRVQRNFAEKVEVEAQKIGINPSEYLRLALIEKVSRDNDLSERKVTKAHRMQVVAHG